MTMPALEVEYSYRACEEITRREAANFYYGIRLLPREKRQAMSAVYAFARRVDDIGDGADERPAKLAALQAERARLAAIATDSGETNGDHLPSASYGDAVAVGLMDALARFDLPLDALDLLIDGVELDVRGTTYETFDDLVVYCREVAGSIGRLCVAIFTGGGANGNATLADDLGVAMQLTNILRDVREDYEHGRVYLPAEDLRRFGCPAPSEISAELIRFEAVRAREWFDRGLRLVDALDARSGSCVLAMTGIYRRILERIAREPEEILQRRISLPAWEKAWLAARSLAGVRT
ncbi:MAG: squalene/phytoene synthase family protein [Solirubrobacterales bacterium]|nr:squalene/phytoene synthase family protein [Solirubrobacterales bacterium]